MNDHGELVKKARHLLREGLDDQYEGMILDLIDLVAAYDKAESEAVAACRTCEKEIKWTIDTKDSPYPFNDNDWTQLRAAGHLAKRAADNWDKAKAEGGA